MMPSFLCLAIISIWALVGAVIGGRTTSLKYQLPSNNDNHFTDDVSTGKEWVEDSLVHAHPLPSPVPIKFASAPHGVINKQRTRYPYPVPSEDTLPFYYATSVDDLQHVRHSHNKGAHLQSGVTGGGSGGQSQKYFILPRPHLTWSSDDEGHGGRNQYQLVTVGGGGGNSWGWRQGPKTNPNSINNGGGGGIGGEWTGTGDNNGITPFSQQQNRRGGGGQVNFAAVSLLGLLALMGTIQHVMTDLDASLTFSNQPNTDFETGNSISGNRPRPLPPTPRPLRPTLRPLPSPQVTSRPSGSNGRPTQSSSSGSMSTSSKKPTRHKNRN